MASTAVVPTYIDLKLGSGTPPLVVPYTSRRLSWACLVLTPASLLMAVRDAPELPCDVYDSVALSALELHQSSRIQLWVTAECLLGRLVRPPSRG